MTEQQQAALIAIGDTLRATPMSWNEIPEQHKALIKSLLRPSNGFTEDQRAFIHNWYLAVDNLDTVEEINNLLPPNTLCVPRVDGEGNSYISSDLITDAEDDGRLSAILPIITGLTLVYRTEDQWPTSENE